MTVTRRRLATGHARLLLVTLGLLLLLLLLLVHHQCLLQLKSPQFSAAGLEPNAEEPTEPAQTALVRVRYKTEGL